MRWRAAFHPDMEKDLRRLDRQVAERVLDAVDAITSFLNEPANVRQHPPSSLLLQNYQPPTWRRRIGDWRLFFRLDHLAGLVIVLAIRHRSEAYR